MLRSVLCMAAGLLIALTGRPASAQTVIYRGSQPTVSSQIVSFPSVSGGAFATPGILASANGYAESYPVPQALLNQMPAAWWGGPGAGSPVYYVVSPPVGMTTEIQPLQAGFGLVPVAYPVIAPAEYATVPSPRPQAEPVTPVSRVLVDVTPRRIPENTADRDVNADRGSAAAGEAGGSGSEAGTDSTGSRIESIARHDDKSASAPAYRVPVVRPMANDSQADQQLREELSRHSDRLDRTSRQLDATLAELSRLAERVSSVEQRSVEQRSVEQRQPPAQPVTAPRPAPAAAAAEIDDLLR